LFSGKSFIFFGCSLAQTKIFTERVVERGGKIVSNNTGQWPPSHIVICATTYPDTLLSDALEVVSNEWLTQCLHTNILLPFNDYPSCSLDRENEHADEGSRSCEAGAGKDDSLEGKGKEEMVARLLHKRFPVEHNNSAVVSVLQQLVKYEKAVGGDDISYQQGKGYEHVNSRALAIQQAVASIKAEGAVELLGPADVGKGWTDRERKHAKQQLLGIDFIGESIANHILQILDTGTCSAVEAHKQNGDLSSSSTGMCRRVSGGHSKAAFLKLVGIGDNTARLLFDCGYRTVEELKRAPLEQLLSNLGTLRPHYRERLQFGLEYSEQLATPPSFEELAEIEQHLRDVLDSQFGGGWEMMLVGGTRRRGGVAATACGPGSKRSSPDADFLITHTTRYPEHEVMTELVERLKADGKLDTRFLMLQAGKNGDASLQRLKERSAEIERGRYNMDMMDRLFGVWITKAGHRRRVDLVMTPPGQWPFALLGWTGSVLLNRLMRRHARDLRGGLAGDKGYCLTNHGLVRIDDKLLVPHETEPGKAPFATEREICEYLELPFLAPEFRNA
jgi:DNA polymerase/3'-5' exonuclease PolX